ncbi:MAG: aminomethyl transferase family protein [Pirellulaceae bacterium]|nr:aminomethyl transferase family protein [Pirellulaceae bacterium]
MDPNTPASSDIRTWISGYQALTAGCGLADVSFRSRVELTGADRVQFLHSFCTNDIKRLAPGEGCEAFLTNHQGKTVGHVYVRILPNAIVLDTAPGHAAGIIEHLNRFVISDRVEFRDLTPITGELLLAGASSHQALASVDVPYLPANLHGHGQFLIAGMDVCVQRVDFAGEPSYFLTTSAEAFAAVQSALLNAGATSCEPAAVNAARIEAGTPLFGMDITEENLPQEIGKSKLAISFTKGCYLGQETVARIDAMGHVNRLLVGVMFTSSEIPAAGTELFAVGKPVGKVTSACWSPRLGRPLAFALLRRAQAVPGTKLTGASAAAEVIALPVSTSNDASS